MKFSAPDSPPSTPETVPIILSITPTQLVVQPQIHTLLPALAPAGVSFFGAQVTNEPRRTVQRQPVKLVPDILLEVMSWLALYDFLDGQREQEKAAERRRSLVPFLPIKPGPSSIPVGYSLIRASQVCAYWRSVAISNCSLWRYLRLKETPYRHYHEIDKEYACRVQRAIPLKTGLHVAYTECPEEELQIFRQEMEQKRLYSYERTRGLTLGFTCLFPLLRDAIQRSVYLNMSASMERITDLMEFDSAPLHPILAPFLRKPPLTRLKELVLDITDHAQYCCPPPSHVPNLERLTIRRAGLFPHFILAIAPDPSSDTIGFSDGDSPFFPRLSDLSLSIPALHLPSLHSFLSIHTSKLTSLTLDTKVDILRLHAEPNNPISLPSLKRLVVLHLTNLLLPHVEAWHCPSLDDLQLAWTPGLPMPTSFNVSNYPKLRRLIYGYPKTIKRPKCPGQCRIVSLAEPHDCRRVLREEELSERRAATNLLIKMLIGLQSLEHLVVMSWAFSGVWGEDDWMLRLTPKKETMEMMWLKGAAENLTEYIPPYIASKPGRPTKASFTSLRERSPIPDTDDSDGEVDRPHLISPKRSKKVDSDGIFCSDRSRLFKSRWEAKVREEEEVDVEDVWEMGKEFECPLLRSLEFRDCRGVEKSGVFRLYMARNLLFDESYSPQWCTGQQPAPATPRRNGPESLSTIYNNVVNSAAQSSHEHNPEHIALEIHAEDPVSPIRSHTDAIQPFCLKFNVSSLTLDKFYELYARYERGLYSVPIPKRRKKMLLALQTVRFGPNMHIS